MLPAIPGRPAAWRSVYCPGILELFHPPAVIREGSSMPVAIRSKAMPTRPYVPKCPLVNPKVAGNSPVYGPGWEFPHVVAQGVAGKPGCISPWQDGILLPIPARGAVDDALPAPWATSPATQTSRPTPVVGGAPGWSGTVRCGSRFSPVWRCDCVRNGEARSESHTAFVILSYTDTTVSVSPAAKAFM